MNNLLQNLCLTVLLFCCCNRNSTIVVPNPKIEFGQPVKVEVKGYTGNIMEPFISRDGNILLFNNLNAAPENTNLYWAVKINDSTFQYIDEITGINTPDLEAIPSLDSAGNLYFVSNRNYPNTLSTIYRCNFTNGNAANIQLVSGISKLQAGWVNFDVEVSADGQLLYFVDAQFDKTGNPTSADIVIAEKKSAGFQRLINSNEIVKNINTDALEYAACISVNQLELYFTRLTLSPTGIPSTEILMATRNNKNEAFNSPSKISTITGFAEAATIALDQKTIYYHKKENDKFVLYKVTKN